MTKLETNSEHCPPLARRHAQHEEEGDDEEEDDGTAHVHRRADPGDGHCTVEPVGAFSVVVNTCSLGALLLSL